MQPFQKSQGIWVVKTKWSYVIVPYAVAQIIRQAAESQEEDLQVST